MRKPKPSDTRKPPGRKAFNIEEVERLEEQVANHGADIPLIRATNQTGFKGVSRNKSATRPFQAVLSGKSLGNFKTAEAAALMYAKSLSAGRANQALAAASLNHLETRRQSDLNPAAVVAIGSTDILGRLRKPYTTTGFKGVSLVSGGSDKRSNLYIAKVPASENKGKTHYLGTFSTASEAVAKIVTFIEVQQRQ